MVFINKQTSDLDKSLTEWLVFIKKLESKSTFLTVFSFDRNLTNGKFFDNNSNNVRVSMSIFLLKIINKLKSLIKCFDK